MPTGIVHSLSMEHYHRDQSYSKSDIVNAARSPAHVLKMRDKPMETTAPMAMGSAVHLMLLEPEKVDGGLVIANCGTRRGKVWEKALDQNPEKIIVLEKEMEAIEAMVQAARQNEIAAGWLGKGYAETSCFVDLEVDGFDLPVKCRPDLLPGGLDIVDIKTARDVTPEGFGRAAYSFRYHWSAYLTNTILDAITGHHHTYYYLALENQFPFESVVYVATPEAIELAEVEITPILSDLAIAHSTGVFKNISGDEKIINLQLPGWAVRKLDHES